VITWLASYPRSGNTLLRMMLHSGWGLETGSVHRGDVGAVPELARLCGHYELKRKDNGEKGKLVIPPNGVVKSHYPLAGQRQPWLSRGRAVYMLRDGRAATVSLVKFWDRNAPLLDIIRGRRQFGGWSRHLATWRKHPRPLTLIRYEDVVADPEPVIETMSRLFGRPTGDPRDPLRRRDEIAALDGLVVRKASDWREEWSAEADEVFWRLHGETMAAYYPEAERGYE